jgi:hypothetical protein
MDRALRMEFSPREGQLLSVQWLQRTPAGVLKDV